MSNELTQSSSQMNLRYATFQHRLGAYALDFALAICTCGIGWLIWSIVVWGQGQTPGKQRGLNLLTQNPGHGPGFCFSSSN